MRLRNTLFLVLLLTVFGAGESFAALGNVWHIPNSAEPSGVPNMRNPLKASATSIVTNYNGSYQFDGDQSSGTLFYKHATNSTWSSASLAFDTQNGNNKYWKGVIPATFNPGDVVQYYFRITFSDRDTTYIYGNDAGSNTTGTESTAQAGPFFYTVLIDWPGGAAAGYASDPASRIHHYKEQAVIGNGYILCMVDANGTLYDIYSPGIGLRQGSGTANEGYKGPEEFIGGPFGCGGTDKQANGQMNVIAGMGGIGLVAGGTNSIHWLKNQIGTDYTDIGQQWSSDETLTVLTTNRLTIASNNIKVIQYDFVPAVSTLPVVTDGTRTNRAVYIKRFLLINREASDRTIDFYYDINYNIKGANIDDGMYWESTVNTTNYNAMIAYDNTARAINGEGCNANGYGDDGFGNFSAGANYKMVSASSYDRNSSVYFATVMKLVTNTTTGAGAPADGSWRDHSATDVKEGWIGKRITIPAGQTNEVDVMIVGSWDDAAAQTGTHNFWGRPMIPWFYTNSMAAVQQSTDTYWSDWVNSGVTIDFPGTYYDRMYKRQLLVSVIHQDAATGAIIAGSHNGAYPFSWPRDGCYAAISFARVGHTNVAAGYFRFLDQTAFRDTSQGFKSHFFQKYTTDGYKVWSAAQPDESASVPWAVFYHYQLTGDSNVLRTYTNLAFSAINSVGFAPTGGSPYDSNLYFNDTFNLVHGNNVWEDSNGLFIYSNASIVRGLRDAANIADVYSLSSTASAFRARANLIRTGIDARIDAKVEPADISHLGMAYPYEAYEPNEARMTNVVEWIHGRQSAGGYTDNLVENDTGSYPDIVGLLNRYAHNVNGGTDNYWNTAAGAYLHSPWFLSTSWYGEYFARWQDYVPGKQMITTNLYTLNLLTNKMDHMMIGAEQIAPTVALQKYPNFWLQTSWPNLWEADMTMVDQMMMFLDYKPQATNNTCYFAPKLPVGWDTMGFSNMMFRAHRFDIGISETKLAPQTTTNVIAGINKKNTGVFDCDIYLRVPVDQISNANHIVVANTNEFLAGTSLNGFTSSVNSNTGAIRVNGPFTSAAQVNTIAVYPDTEKQGVTDYWKAQHGYAQGTASSTVGANGHTLKESYVAGLDPASAGSKLSISNIAINAGQITVNWFSAQDGTTVARLYDVYRMQGPFTNGAAWTRISQNASSAGATTAINEDVSATTITQRFYRVTIAGHTNDVATPEIVGVQKLTLREGRNYVSMSMVPGTNTLLSVLGTNQLPQGATESTATTVDIWDQSNQTFANANRYWLDTGVNGWRQSNTTTPSNDVLLDPNKGLIITIRTGEGAQTLRTVGFVATNSQIQVVQSNGYSVASSTFPRSVALTGSGLEASGFVGGDSKITSDVLYFWNATTQGWTTEIWLDSTGSIWRNEDASVATKQLQPGEAFLVRRRARPSNMNWTNSVPYSVPLQGP